MITVPLPVVVAYLVLTTGVAILGLLTYQRLLVGRTSQQVQAREFEHLQHAPVTFPGIVWGCAKWRKCGERLIETPPYAEEPPFGRCEAHGLRMDTVIVERRVLS